MDNEEMVMMSKMIITWFYASNQTNNRNFTPSVQGEYSELSMLRTCRIYQLKRRLCRRWKGDSMFWHSSDIKKKYENLQQILQIYVLSINFLTIENCHETGFYWNTLTPLPYGKAAMNDETHKKETAFTDTIWNKCY